MTLSLPVIMVASGFWLILLLGCVLFVMLASNFKKRYLQESATVVELNSEVVELKSRLQQVMDSGLPENHGSEIEPEEVGLLKKKISLLEAELAEAEKPLDNKEDSNMVSKLRLDKLNEKYENMQAMWESTNQELIRADGKIAELLGAKAALEKERDMLERRLDNFAESEANSDTREMREVIINFTEDSRELLLEIERLNTEKAGLEQQIKDMEEGGKGTAGKVVGLQRKLDEAEEQIAALKAGNQ